MEDTLLKKEYTSDGWYEVYSSGKLRTGIKRYFSSGIKTVTSPLKHKDNNYTIQIFGVPNYTLTKPYLTKQAFCHNTNSVVLSQLEKDLYRITYKSAEVRSISAEYNENYICPVNKTAYTQGTPIPKTVSFKGPTKTANVENISSDPSVGVGTGTLNEICLSLTTNQFITLKVDISGAKVNNLPTGFTFANSEITGAAKNPGEYRFNIVSEATTVPVIMKVSNIIRIS